MFNNFRLRPIIFIFSGSSILGIMVRLIIIFFMLFAVFANIYISIWGIHVCQMSFVIWGRLIGLTVNAMSFYIMIISLLVEKSDKKKFVKSKFILFKSIKPGMNDDQIKEVMRNLHDREIKIIIKIFQTKVVVIMLTLSTTVALLLGILSTPK